MSNLVMMFFSFSLLISLILVFISVFFMENKLNEAAESPFECGFEPISYSRTPFSMQFFSVTIIFLIFDLEIIIILPLMKNNQPFWLTNIIMTLIILILFLGLIIEWYDDSLSWSL